MKLKSLKLLDGYKSLHKGFEIDFLKDNISDLWEYKPYCLVGLNGSGKSNLLEVIADIFYHIECIYLDYKPNGFEGKGKFDRKNAKGFYAEVSFPESFELEYYFYKHGSYSRQYSSEYDIGYDAHIKIVKEKEKSPQIFWLNRFECEKEERQELYRTEVKQFLPDYIVAYSSGENQTLNLPFFKMRFIQYDEYLDLLTKDLDYNKPESRFIYLDDYYNQAILLSIYLLRDKKTLKPFTDEIGLTNVKSFRLIINRSRLEKVHNDVFATIKEQDRVNKAHTHRELTSLINNSIEKLQKCSTSHSYDAIKKELILDFFVNEECKKAFQYHFKNDAFELFKTFQVLLNLNNYKVSKKLKSKIYQSKNIYINQDVVPLPYDDDRIFRFKDVELKLKTVDGFVYTKSLSDGEYQFIHAIGLCLLFRDSNSLFLLDEPETHFNPDWRSNFISTLKDCLEQDLSKGQDNRRDILITSHSPFIVSDCQPENVIIFNKRNKKIQHQTAKEKKIRTFGTSVNILTEEIFGKRESISELSLRIINDIKKMPLETLDDIQNAKEEARVLGESVEKVLLFRELILKEDELNKKND